MMQGDFEQKKPPLALRIVFDWYKTTFFKSRRNLAEKLPASYRFLVFDVNFAVNGAKTVDFLVGEAAVHALVLNGVE